jgi:integrase
VAWAVEQGLASLPAAPETVALYLTARAGQGRRPATLEQDLAAIAGAHRAAGLPSPRDAEAVRMVRAGIRRERGTAPRQVAPLLAGHVRALVGALPRTLLGMRDRALLLVGFAGAFRRSELAALRVEDLDWTDEGLKVRLRRSKTDQEGEGRTVEIPRGARAALCPVRALEAWLTAAGVTAGAVFREVTRHGAVGGVGAQRPLRGPGGEAGGRRRGPGPGDFRRSLAARRPGHRRGQGGEVGAVDHAPDGPPERGHDAALHSGGGAIQRQRRRWAAGVTHLCGPIEAVLPGRVAAS